MTIERIRAEVDRQAEPLTAHLLLWLWRHPEKRSGFGRTDRPPHPAAQRDKAYQDRRPEARTVGGRPL